MTFIGFPKIVKGFLVVCFSLHLKIPVYSSVNIDCLFYVTTDNCGLRAEAADMKVY